jgi:hypothetical protein
MVQSKLENFMLVLVVVLLMGAEDVSAQSQGPNPNSDVPMYILLRLPDICTFKLRVANILVNLTPNGQISMKKFLGRLESIIQNKIIYASEVSQTESYLQQIDRATILKISTILGITRETKLGTVCSVKAKEEFRDQVRLLNGTQQKALKELFDNIFQVIKNELPLMYSEAYSSSLADISNIENSDPYALTLISPYLNDLFFYSYKVV